MTSPNHIVGGLAVTGITLSFFDINIFSNELYLFTCVFGSLLPDIDHTKSIIGKIFYPIAKYLDNNFGHRTITHSLTFLAPLFLIILILELNIINPFYERSGIAFSLVFLFSFFSHLILDMLTVQGIPMFYPFLKNPCVIPANPTLRFRSGNIKSEAIALFIFTFVLFTSYDLFQYGFWTSYNRSFATVKHVFREFKKSENLLIVDYKYTFNGVKNENSAYLLDANETKLELWNNKLISIDEKDHRFKNIEVKPRQTQFKYSIEDLDFFNLSINQLNDTLRNKIVSGKVISTDKFLVNKMKALKGSIELYKVENPLFKWIVNDSLNNELENKLSLLKAKLKDVNKFNFDENQKLKKHKILLSEYQISLENSTDLYNKNKFEKLIIERKKLIQNFSLKSKNSIVLNKEISILKKQLELKKVHTFSGSLKVFLIPNEDSFIVSN